MAIGRGAISLDLVSGEDESQTIATEEVQVEDSKRLSFNHFAEVFRGSWRGEDVLVKQASKLWRKTQGRLSSADVFVAQTSTVFRQEFELMRSMNHPNIAQAFGICSPGTLDVALVIECLPTCLQLRLTRLPYLTLAQGVDIELDVTKAVEYLHKLGLVHRDISVSNVFLCLNQTGSRLTAKLTDFSNVGKLGGEAVAGAASRSASDGASLDVHDIGALAFCISLRVESIDVDDRDHLLAFLKHPENREFEPLVDVISQCMERQPEIRPTVGALIGKLQALRSSDQYRRSNAQTKKPPAILGIPSVGAGASLPGVQMKAAASGGDKVVQLPHSDTVPSQAAG